VERKPDFLPAYNYANLNPKTCHTFWVKSYKYDRDKTKPGRAYSQILKDEMICIDSSMRHLKNDLSMSATDLHSIYVPGTAPQPGLSRKVPIGEGEELRGLMMTSRVSIGLEYINRCAVDYLKT